MNQTYIKFLFLMVRAKRVIHITAEQHGLTAVQGMLLIMFNPEEGKSMQRVAELMGCDASNITGLVDKLEGTGCIERTVDPSDRRVKVIQLTSQGSDVREKLLAAVEDAHIFDMTKVDPEDATVFYKVLDTLLD